MKILVPVMFEVTISDFDESKFERSKVERMVRENVAQIAADGESHVEMAINICGALDIDAVDSVKTTISLR